MDHFEGIHALDETAEKVEGAPNFRQVFMISNKNSGASNISLSLLGGRFPCVWLRSALRGGFHPRAGEGSKGNSGEAD